MNQPDESDARKTVEMRWSRYRRLLSSLLPATAICAWTAGVQAGNADAFYLSGEAGMQAGAIVADSRGGGSVWYNPAGLASLSGTRLDVNVSAYAINFGAEADFDSTLPRAEETRLTLSDINVVPAALALTRRFGKVGVGVGIFVPTQSVVALRTYLEAPPDEEGTALQFGYDSTVRVQEYHLGPGIGWDPIENLSVGASLLVNYRTHYESVDVSSTIEDGGESYSSSNHWAVDSIGVGLEMVLGAQLQLTPRWRVGAVVRTPAVRLAQVHELVETELSASSTGELHESMVFDEAFDIGTQLLTPFRFHLGVSHELESLRASAEGSVTLPLENNLAGISQRLTWNARFGLRGNVAPAWTLGGGLFTDRSPSKAPTQFQEHQINYYGATVALAWLNPYGVYSRDGVTMDEPTSLIFGTSVAFSYAVGVGDLVSAEVGPDPAGGLLTTSITSDVVAHEFSLHISSTISE